MPLGFAVVALLVGSSGAAHGQDAASLATNAAPAAASLEAGQTDATHSGHQPGTHFGGPNSVGAQLKHDGRLKGPLFPFKGFDDLMKPYYDFKSNLQKKTGLNYGMDYNVLFQGATESPGESSAASGALRFFGHWELIGRESGNTGVLGYKVENRHRLGTDIAPQALGSEIGYAGLSAVPFSDAGWMLSNFYWQQELLNKRFGLILGIVDTTDYVDTYGLVNPWTDFNNLAFGTDPTIPAPNQGLGVAVGGAITTNLYVMAGFADGNGDPTNPLEGFDTFFTVGEYFKHVEVGWITSTKRKYEDNIHVTAWQTDARDDAGVPSGWGVALSASHLFADRWLPFARFGFSDGGGGAPLEDSISIGTGYYLRDKSDMLGLGLNWGRPSHKNYGSGLADQYTIELFYRLQLLEHLAITPDVQLLINPALNPDADVVGVFGLRARLAF
jgi:porin